MKRLFLLLALCSMVAVGCTEGGVDDNIDNGGNNTEQPDNGGNEDESDIPENIFFGLDKESAAISPDGGSVDVVVYSNYKWEISGTSDWCTPSITKGDANEDGQKVTFSADVAYDNREATFWFRCADEKIKVVVSQKLKESIIPDENNTFEISAEGGIAVINYQTNVECEVVIPSDAQHWISLAPETRGLESGCATLNIAKSNVGADRRAVVKVVKMGDQSVFAEYTITQERNMDYIILYTTTNGETISPNNFGYLTNTYEDGVGMLAFDGSKVTSIGSYAFNACNSLTSVTIGNGVTSIGNYAFGYCNSLTSITIGKGVTSIRDDAFYNCTSLTRVTIGNGVTSIGLYAFFGCTSLTSVYITDITAWCEISFGNDYSNPLLYAENLYLNNELVTDLIIPDGATKIGSYAFRNCDSLTSVTIGNGVTSIGGGAFMYCNSLTSVTIGNGVTSIGSYAFYNCSSLTSITIPDSVTSIRDEAFYNCTGKLIVNCNIPSASSTVFDGAFYGSKFTQVTIGDSVTSIGSYAFYDCDSLTSVTIGNGVTSIGDGAFVMCNSLTSITIPDSVTSIGDSAFGYCYSLKEVYCKPTTPPSGYTTMFDKNASGRTIYVPRNSVSAYKSASGWSEYASAIVEYDF